MEGLINLECIQAGGGTHLVDQGRSGFRHLGIVQGGAADQRAASRARELLELAQEAPLLEFTLHGGQWLLSGKGQFVITGADMDWRINGRPVELYTTIDFDGDYMLDSSMATNGCRSYLAINGHWEMDQLLGSCSPLTPSLDAIDAGWSATIRAKDEVSYTSDLDVYQHIPQLPMVLSVSPGPEWCLLTSIQQTALLALTYEVAGSSNRQGIRLKSDSSLFSEIVLDNQISSPVLPGTIQLTPTGPVLLFKDAQTIGGFPRILLLAPNNLDALGQVKPGDEVTFKMKV